MSRHIMTGYAAIRHAVLCYGMIPSTRPAPPAAAGAHVQGARPHAADPAPGSGRQQLLTSKHIKQLLLRSNYVKHHET